MASKNLGNLFVTLSAKTESFQKDFKEAGKSVQALADVAEKVRNASAVAFAGMTAAIGLATKAASDQIEAQNQLALSLRNAGESADITAFNDLASQLQATTKFSDDAALGAAGLLVKLGATADQARTMLPAVADLAQAMGMDLESAAMLAGKALAGNTDALGRYGIKLSDADKATLELGSDSEKLAVIMDNLGKFQGAAAEGTKTAAGAFVQMQNAMGEISESFGMILDQPLSDFFNDVSTFAKKLSDEINDLSPGMKDFIADATLTGLAVAGITTAVSGIIAVLPLLVAQFQLAAPLIMAALAPVTAAIAGIGLGVFAVGPILDSMIGDGKMMDRMADAFYKMTNAGPTITKMPSDEPGLVLSPPKIAGKTTDKDAIDVDAITASLGLEDLGPTDRMQLGPTEPVDFSGSVGAPGNAEASGAIGKIQIFAEGTANAFQQSISASAGIIGDRFKNAAGFAGQLFDDAVAGMQQGGAMGAAVAVITDLLLQAPAMQQAFQMLNDFLGRIVMALNPLVRAILPAFAMFLSPLNAIIGVIGNLFAQLEPTLQIFAKLFVMQFMPYIVIASKILKALAPALNSFAMVLETVTYTFASIINGIISMLQSVLQPLSDLPFGIGDAFDSVIDTLEDFKLTFDNSYVMADMPDDANELAGAMENLTETTKSVTESLTNVPQGFKVAAARYGAITPGLGAGTPFGAAGSARTNIFNQGAITIVNQDPVKIWEKLKRVMEADNFNSTGTTIQTASPFALPSYG